MDEPTSALDATNQAAVVDLLVERLDDGATMIGAFHDAPSLARLARRVAHMDRGELIRLGPPEDVRTPELEAVS